MPPIQHLVFPKQPTILASQAHVDLPGYDLFLHYEHSILSIQAELDVPKFEETLSRTLQQLCPHAAGRLRCLDGRWFIELTNSAIPVDIEYKLNMSSYSLLDGNWVVQDDLSPFLSYQPADANIINDDSPLLRFKLTFFDHETCIGTSWHHSLGDGTVMLRCMHGFSQQYQGLPYDPAFPAPTFQKYQFPTPSRPVVAEFWSRLPFFHPSRQMSAIAYIDYMGSKKEFDHVRWQIDYHDLRSLRSAVSSRTQNGQTLSKQDCLIAYLVSVLNYNRSTLVQEVTNMVTCRDVSTSFFDEDAASCFVVDVTANVPTDMAGIATALRGALIQSREPDYIHSWFTLKNALMLEAADSGNVFPYFPDEDGLVVVSFIPMDWCCPHFGYPDGTRFHTAGVDKHLIRFFRSNPARGDDGVWRAQLSVEISMGVAPGLEPCIVETLSRGVRHMVTKERPRL